MELDQLIATTNAALPIFGRIRERLRAVFVPMHRAYTSVQASRARAGAPEVIASRLLLEIPVQGLGRFLGMRLADWMVAGVNATRDADEIADPRTALGRLLLEEPPPPPPLFSFDDAFAVMRPLEWFDRARTATLAACQELSGRVEAAAGSQADAATVVELTRIVSEFCRRSEMSLTRIDSSVVAVRSHALLCASISP